MPASLDYLKDIRIQLIDCVINVAEEMNPNDPLINNFFNKTDLKAGDTVINFNYDLLVDDGLFKTKKWNPYVGLENSRCGYGFGVSSLLQGFKKKPLKEKNMSVSEIKYFKLHGSINWVKVYGENIEINWGLFNPEGISRGGNHGQRDNFIITPSFLKTFEEMPIKMIWKYAQKSLSEAEEIYIIGYSFPKADILARQLLMHVNESLKKIIVIDPLTDTYSKADKREDIISMLSWTTDSHFWANKIKIIEEQFKDYVMNTKQV